MDLQRLERMRMFQKWFGEQSLASLVKHEELCFTTSLPLLSTHHEHTRQGEHLEVMEELMNKSNVPYLSFSWITNMPRCVKMKASIPAQNLKNKTTLPTLKEKPETVFP